MASLYLLDCSVVTSRWGNGKIHLVRETAYERRHTSSPFDLTWCGLTPYGEPRRLTIRSLKRAFEGVTCVPCRRKIQAVITTKEKTR